MHFDCGILVDSSVADNSVAGSFVGDCLGSFLLIDTVDTHFPAVVARRP